MEGEKSFPGQAAHPQKKKISDPEKRTTATLCRTSPPPIVQGSSEQALRLAEQVSSDRSLPWRGWMPASVLLPFPFLPNNASDVIRVVPHAVHKKQEVCVFDAERSAVR